MRTPICGTISWTLFVKSDSYRGLDQEKPIKFQVLPLNSVKRVFTTIFKNLQNLIKNVYFFKKINFYYFL